jgi:mono/diheme cytochrome c family protein
MESFADLLSEPEVDAIHAYLLDEAWKGYRAQQAKPAHP